MNLPGTPDDSKRTSYCHIKRGLKTFERSRMSLPRKLDLNELIITEEDLPLSQSPSMQQPCLPHVPQEMESNGCDNPVFILDESQYFIPNLPLLPSPNLPFDNHISSNGTFSSSTPINSPKHFNNKIHPTMELRKVNLTPLNIPGNLGSRLFSSPSKWTNSSFDSQGITDMLMIPDPIVGLRRSSVVSNISVESLSLVEYHSNAILPAINIDSVSRPVTPMLPSSPTYKNSQDDLKNAVSNESNPLWPEKGSQVYRQIHRLVSSLTERAKNIKEKVISQPPTPTSTSSLEKTSSAVGDGDEAKETRNRLDSFALIDHSRASSVLPNGLPKPERYIGCGKCRIRLPRKLRKLHLPETFEQTSYGYISWLFVVTLCYMYNSYAIFLRFFFSTYQTERNLYIWLIGDYLSDFVYLLDIIIFKPRLKFIQDGLLVEDRRLTMRHYVRSVDFKVDVLALLPLDIFYVIVGTNTMLRMPRILKITSFWEFFDAIDKVVKAPHIPRVLRTLNYMIFLIHINACAYYAFSAQEGFNSTNWTYDRDGDPYIRCFFLTFKIATSIGNIVEPTNLEERIFMIINWLLGVFVFALLIGQIRDILSTAGSAKKEHYRKVVDSTIAYLQAQKLPKQLQDKVKMWFSFQWEQAKTINENEALEILPKKMKTDIAISVHYQTLSKVQLFRDCDKALLRDLVLKLKPVLYLPGDLVCTKGEVGKEMYIVSYGQVQVVGGPNDDIVFATLGEGSVFGEISLLALAGGNRRTANVKSVGFANLFVLSKADLHDTIQDYPQAQAILKKKAKQLIKENAARTKKHSVTAECIIKSREGTPKMIKTVIQIIDPNSQTGQILSGKKQKINREILLQNKSYPEYVVPQPESSSKSESNQQKMEDTCLESAINRDLIEVSRGEEEDNDVLIVETSERDLVKGEKMNQNRMTVSQEDGTINIVQILNQDSMNLSAQQERTGSLLSLQIINTQQPLDFLTKRDTLFTEQPTSFERIKKGGRGKLKKKSISQDTASKSYRTPTEELQLQRVKRPSLPSCFHLLKSPPVIEDILSESFPPSRNIVECAVTVHRELSPSVVDGFIDSTHEQTDHLHEQIDLTHEQTDPTYEQTVPTHEQTDSAYEQTDQ